MEEYKYCITDLNGEILASDMALNDAIICLKAFIEEYYEAAKFGFIIKRVPQDKTV